MHRNGSSIRHQASIHSPHISFHIPIPIHSFSKTPHRQILLPPCHWRASYINQLNYKPVHLGHMRGNPNDDREYVPTKHRLYQRSGSNADLWPHETSILSIASLGCSWKAQFTSANCFPADRKSWSIIRMNPVFPINFHQVCAMTMAYSCNIINNMCNNLIRCELSFIINESTSS